MTTSSYYAIVISLLICTGISLYSFIEGALSLRDKPLKGFIHYIICIQCVAAPLFLLSVTYTLLRYKTVVPTHTLDNLPGYLPLLILSILGYGVINALGIWVVLKNGKNGAHSAFIEIILKIHKSNTLSGVYIGQIADWNFRVQCVIVDSIPKRELRGLFYIAGWIDDIYIYLRGTNFFLCLLSTQFFFFLRFFILFVFFIAGLPFYVYISATFLLLLQLLINWFLQFTYSLQAYYALFFLKRVSAVSGTEKEKLLFPIVQNPPSLEAQMDSILSEDEYLSVILGPRGD